MTLFKSVLRATMLLFFVSSASSQDSEWTVTTFTMNSTAIADNLLGLDHARSVRVWLPPSYAVSEKRYPVIYYLHNYGWSNGQMDEVERVHEVFQRAVTRGLVREFVFVAGDFTATPYAGTFYGNNPVVGRWFDHIENELVPEVDRRFRTLPREEARGLAGDFIGGYAALRFAMLRPGTFSSVYAMHPVGTGIGERLMRHAPDWRILNTAASIEEVQDASGATLAFLMMAQSYAPNPGKPPLYADFMVDLNTDGELIVDAERTRDLHRQFLLDHQIAERVEALQQLRGLAFDWGRYDSNPDHVYANQKFTRELDEFQIEHFAEEYRGNQWAEKWVPYGRVEDRMLPFFDRFLEFD